VRGPYLFEEARHAVTVNSGRYVHTRHNFLSPEISRRGINQQTMCFQKDRANAHTATASMAVVHVISRRGDLPWPARPPDLSVCDYFLWGYLKAKEFINRPRTDHEVKVAIRHIAVIPPTW
jgi:hypothetical protein